MVDLYKRAKIVVVGLGHVGDATTISLIEQITREPEWETLPPEVLLVSAKGDVNKAKAIVKDFAPLFGGVIRAADFEAMKTADVIVFCAGLAQEKGQSREDLWEANRKLVDEIFTKHQVNTKCILVAVTNPVDLICTEIARITELTPQRIIGFGGDLDTYRLRYLIRKETGEYPEQSYTAGEHGPKLIPVFDVDVPDKEKILRELVDWVKEILDLGAESPYRAAGRLIADLTLLLASPLSGKPHIVSYYDPRWDTFVTAPMHISSEVGAKARADLHHPEAYQRMTPEEERKFTDVAEHHASIVKASAIQRYIDGITEQVLGYNPYPLQKDAKVDELLAFAEKNDEFSLHAREKALQLARGLLAEGFSREHWWAERRAFEMLYRLNDPEANELSIKFLRGKKQDGVSLGSLLELLEEYSLPGLTAEACRVACDDNEPAIFRRDAADFLKTRGDASMLQRLEDAIQRPAAQEQTPRGAVLRESLQKTAEAIRGPTRKVPKARA